MSEPIADADLERIYHRSAAAAAERTLSDILHATARGNGDALAIDDGSVALTYAELAAAVTAKAAELAAVGIRRGDRVGIRIPSGTVELYVAILGVLEAGAAYVPVDADDPDERARTVFAEADVVAILIGEGEIVHRRPVVQTAGRRLVRRPTPEDDAWVIFTSGSTGMPKGVAVSHRSAAAFVDAESRLFLTGRPLGPGDRVLAGLSVAFDASCEEMWLAWAHGACLVPAPRALVRTGMDLGPWLAVQGITVISTVPTLAGLWRPEDLTGVRLLVFGGEACPPELAARLAMPGREVWNTYGPTETTVVACATRLTGEAPVRIGVPLDGWDLTVVDGAGRVVEAGEIGELVIGGVGVARYLDPLRDAEKFAALPALGWQRAYRTGDLVRYDAAGLVFVGRADDQVKLGGRRIELGEVDAALLALPGIAGAAAAVRSTAAGHQVLVGYLAPAQDVELDLAALRTLLQERLPAPLVPLLAPVGSIPTRGSGKVDRDALPWPLERLESEDLAPAALVGAAGWLAEQWTRTLGVAVQGPDADFFADGGGSLSAAQLVSALRERYPNVTVADVYENPNLGALAQRLEELEPTTSGESRSVMPTPRRAQVVQSLAAVPLHAVIGLRWLTWLAVVDNVLAATGSVPWVSPVSWWWVLAGWLVLVTPLGRMGMTILVARTLLRTVKPGRYPRGGSMHLRLWFTESFAAAAGADNLAGAPWVSTYARALGAKIGRHVDLHSLPPVTGLLTLGKGCSIEPEVDLTGHWLDGDVLHIGKVRVDARATVGSRSVLAPGIRVGQGAEIPAGSAVLVSVPPGERWTGSPATFAGPARHDWPHRRAPRAPGWVAVYGLTAVVLGALPLVAGACGLAVVGLGVRGSATLGGAARGALAWVPAGAVVMFVVLAVLTLVCVRLLGIRLSEGHHPVRSRVGWQVWATERLMDDARTWLFPLYSSLATPTWLRSLGATVGRGVEASTVLLLPRMTTIGDGAFLADDTLIGSYELGRGWLRIDRAKVGKRAFLGNSGMTAAGRAVPKRGLVAVLSATPEHAKSGTSWLGSPPVRLRRAPTTSDERLTFAPSVRLRVARAVVEALRVIPVVTTVGIGVALLGSLQAVLDAWGGLAAGLLAGPLAIAAAALGCTLATLAKWVLVGRVRVGEHPLWSSFVWRNELADTFVETVAVPWFARTALGTPALTLWLRSLGARIGRGVWCETIWLPEADLVALGDGATVNRGCVLQTHLFHDRIMSMDTVTLAAGATLGPHGVILPAASIGAGATVGPAALVLRGDELPAGSRWTGNPVAPWPAPVRRSR
ncbi:MAG TPA: Pls/PosA family non-ribosomal peptide synthetase [Cellulomonas sp.]|uniref:Pls/PosA family non-ribosomal peptide synthetase n=1 Tax=Cellulomonas sp. TaxID=40001 RepID=UPI002E31D27A|nr:Pls/PosA family non-ribosomal peptide synthetase [Cellulomonas sp.]HEX5333537.1 Pls/PosA family non-ribosomal peptide synthetase [Cellulomonas sp.]